MPWHLSFRDACQSCLRHASKFNRCNRPPPSPATSTEVSGPCPPGSSALGITASAVIPASATNSNGSDPALPLFRFHSLMVRSSEPEARLPSGSAARANTTLVWPTRVRSSASDPRRLAPRGTAPPLCCRVVIACCRSLCSAEGGWLVVLSGQRASSWEGSCSGWAASTWEAWRNQRRNRSSWG